MIVASVLAARPATAQIDFDREPISYRRATRHDPVSQLQARLEQKAVRLDFDPARGYLPELLHELNISPESQTLVFSKTSFQRSKISAKRPRALYFNDESYIGWVQNGDVIEISSIDPRLGAIFYTLEQRQSGSPILTRQTDDCLQCHAGSMTDGVPGHMIRSIFPTASGTPVLSAGSFRTTYRSPLSERWGGWYVTGTHAQERHMGNTSLRGTDDPDKLDRDSGANLTDLSSRLDVRPYLSPHSDIVALMVLEHQVPAHNQLTLAGYRAQLARQEQEVLNRMAGKPAGEPMESIDRRYDQIAADLVEYLLLAGEAPLAGPIRGTSGFSSYFASLGPRDRQGRSLREFDLQTRLFKYPCSYLIYSRAFDELPDAVKKRVYERLWQILGAEDTPSGLARLTGVDRRAIREILAETKPGLPEYWRTP